MFTEVTICVRCACNYDCFYCIGNNQKEKLSLFSIKRIKEIYDSIEGPIFTNLECGSSEPALHPQIKELLEIANERGFTSTPTNNSIHPEKWIPKKNASNMHITISLHPLSERKLDQFFEYISSLKEWGATINATFIAHPDRIDTIEKYISLFQKNDLYLSINAFVGEHQGKKYPESYTQTERQSLKLDNINTFWGVRLDEEAVLKDFSGIPCLAGYKSFLINSKGEIQRCLYDPRPLKELYDCAVPCCVNRCGCGWRLKELNSFDNAFILNRLKIPGFSSYIDNEKVFQEKRIIYWELMKEHDKINKIILDAENFISENNYLAAKRNLTTLLNYDNTNIDALNDLAYIQILENAKNEAENTLKKILALEPANEIAINNLNVLNDLQPIQ